MPVEIIPIWVTTFISAVGVTYAIFRNGNRGKKADEKLKTELTIEVRGVKKQLDDPKTGLSAIKESVEEQKLHCVKVSTGLSIQVETNAVEIAELRKRRNTR